ncbi:unnamed protein product [Malus baccata var. baccata]
MGGAPSRKDTSGGTAGVLGSHVRDKKKWRRVQRQDCPASQILGVVPQLRRQLRWECGEGSFPSVINQEVGGIKRGVEPSSMDLVPSPQKKNRGPSQIAMILVFWNCRGLGSDTAVRALHGLIRNKRPSMIFLSETKMKDHRLNGWMSSHFSPADIPWLCAGDFNEFLWDHEKSGGVEVLYNRPRYLETFMQATNLWDLDFNGPAFTWHGMRHGHLVEERIDRALINGLWQDLWPNSLVTHKTVLGSDYCPFIIQSDSESMRGRRAFKFEAFWAKENDCDQVVRSCWNRQDPNEILVRWMKKINDCKSSLIRWSRNKFKKRGLLIQELLHQLQELQRDWRSNIEVIKQKSQLVDELRAQEESYWMQRSRVRWLREGDANTKFFHNSTLQRRRCNQIIKIKDELGNWVEQPGRVRKLVEDHFIQTFTTGGARNWGSLLDCISPRVMEDMNLALLKPVSEDEIKTAIFKMGGLKAPGPDGFQGIFYQSFWEHVYGDVCALVRELMQGSSSPTSLNATYIVLIPKVPHSETVSQFRPISLCNYSYKVLSKVMANRLKVILPMLISPSQNAFVAGRTAKQKFEMGVKLDMQKAYDRVEWDFLDAVMERMGFCGMWRRLVMGCVSSVNFAVLLNGQLGNNIYFGANVPKGVAVNLGGILGVSVVDNPDTYLGVPAIWGWSKKRGLAYVKGRILGKLQGWKQSALSRASREILIKAVVQGIPAYPMCIFKFPSVVCLELDALAKKGARASWAWSSLLSGRELLASGSHWQIMGGDDVRVWVDRWLPSLPSGHPMPPGTVSVTSNLRVSSLIDSSSRQWDFDFLRPFLSSADQRVIQETIIGDSRWKDRLVWAANWNGKYSVKSGYRWLQIRSIEVRDHQMPAVRSISKTLWKCIWQLAVPPKIRHFLWVSLHLGLPTGKALFNIRLSSSPSCPLRLSADETVEHVFLRCPWVAAVWFGGALNYKVDAAGIVSWTRWLQDVFSINWGSSADRQWFQAYVSFSCWFIWKARCDFVFNQVPVNPSKFIFSLSFAFRIFLLAVSFLGCARPVLDSREEVAGRWCPHSSPFVKINVDASWSKSSRMGFAGVVARQVGGRFRVAVRSSIMAPSSLVAESFAILRGCELGASLGFSSVIIESDSLQAISCLNGSLENGSWEAFPILARAQRLGSAFQNCRWSWVPRSANLAADVLASADFTEMCDFVWVDRPPSSLVYVLSNDGLPCPH